LFLNNDSDRIHPHTKIFGVGIEEVSSMNDLIADTKLAIELEKKGYDFYTKLQIPWLLRPCPAWRKESWIILKK
jgi:hypothetical protein